MKGTGRVPDTDMKEYLKNFFEEFDYPEEARAALGEAYDKLAANAEEHEKFCGLLREYEEKYDGQHWRWLNDCKGIAERSGVHSYQVDLLLYIFMAKHLRELYIERGYDLDVWHNTVLDLKYKLFECKAVMGIWGSFVALWFPGFFNLTRFGFGRLQFEMTTLSYQDYETNGVLFKEGCPVIGVHIPRTLTPLDKESCDKAYKQAADFFQEKEGLEHVAFTCGSWLLYPPHLPYLPEKSNIRRFMSDYDIFHVQPDKEDGYPEMWRLFDMGFTGNIDDYPGDSSLRRGYKQMLKDGIRPGDGYGVYFYR